MADPFEILFKMALHLDGHPIFKQPLFLSNKFRRKVAYTLLGILTIRGATKIHTGVQKAVTAFLTSTGGVILKKFHINSALGAFGLKDGPRLPITAILSRAFHGYLPFDGQFSIED
jgi:hypothetical protein